MFIATLFTIANMWEQAKYPLMGEWREKMFMHTQARMHAHTHIKRNVTEPSKEGNLVICIAWMDLEGIMLSEIS